MLDFIRSLFTFVTYRVLWFKSLGRLFRLDKIAKFFGRKPGRGLLTLSIPARIGLLTFFFLIVCLVTVYVSLATATDKGVLSRLYEWKYVAVLVLLVIAIPIVVYKTVKLWLEGESALFPDIDEAWTAGMAELDLQGIDIQQVPLFLVLGAPNENVAQAILDAAGREMPVRGVPKGKVALQWFGDANAVYVVCTGTGCLTKLASVARTAIVAPSGGGGGGARAAAPRDIKQTLVPGQDDDPMAGPASAPAPPPMPNIRGTMEIPSVRDSIVMAGTGPGAAAAPLESRELKIVVDKADRELEQQRLEYLCRRIVRERKPYCPINGVLCLLPFKVLESQSGAGEMTVAVASDMRVAMAVFKLRFPVNALVTGLEEELGFQELVRRVGQNEAAGRRFGKGFDVWKPPIPEQMEALTAHACGAFEDWAYSLFRKDDALKKKTGNERLYLLLCKIRGRVQMHLEKVLAEGFGYDPDRSPDATPVLFGGCYFAATGERDDRRAFVAGVVRDKLVDQEGDLEWTPEAIAEDRRCRSWATIVIGIDAVLAVTLALVLYWAWN
jgi:hypothetical protein